MREKQTLLFRSESIWTNKAFLRCLSRSCHHAPAFRSVPCQGHMAYILLSICVESPCFGHEPYQSLLLYRVGRCSWIYDSKSPNSAPLCIGNRASVRALPTEACVVILLKACHWGGSYTMWMFPHISQVTIGNGRMPLTPVSSGLVLSLPSVQVEAYSTDVEDTPTHAAEA